MSLVSVDDIKTRLRIPVEGTSKLDEPIEAAIAAAEAEVLVYLCLDSFDPTSYTLTADVPVVGRPFSAIRIGVAPLVSVSEVLNGTTVVDLPNYVCRSGWIRLCCGNWRSGCRGGTVTVVAGFDASVPLLAAQLASLRGGISDYASLRFSVTPGVTAETIGRHKIVRGMPGADGTNGMAHWPPTLTAALLPFWKPMTAVQFEREC